MMGLSATPRPAELKPAWLGGLERLPWRWAQERLERERNYWLITVRRDGLPQARPVWGLWDQNLLFLSVGGGGLTRTARRAGERVSAHIDSASDVVIVEGTLVRVAGGDTDEEPLELGSERLRTLIEAWNVKYGRSWSSDKHGLNFAVQPEVVMAWHEREDRSSADASGKWLF